MSNTVIFWLIVAGIGFLGGFGEIVSRYHHSLFRLLISFPSLLYLLLNALASVIALALIHVFGWLPPGLDPKANVAWAQGLAAGFGGLILIRTTLTIHTSNPTLAIGLSPLLEKLLSALEKSMGQRETTNSLLIAKKIMEGVSFDKALQHLPNFFFNLNTLYITEEAKKKLKNNIDLLRRSSHMSNDERVILLGSYLVEHVGEDVLKLAVELLHNDTSPTSSVNPPPVEAPDKQR